MNGEIRKWAGAASTTTLSTIVLQSQVTKIVIATLHSGSKVSLQILEMNPQVAFLGHTFEDAASLRSSHLRVVEQLQSKQSPVEELLRQADELIVNQKPKAGVYAAMAESLGAAWQDLHELLDQRRAIVDKNFLFRGHLQDFNVKVDQLESMLAKAKSSLKNPNQLIKEVLGQKKKMLEASAFALQEGDALVNALHRSWGKTFPGLTPPSTRAELSSSMELVEIWMESIHGRRTQVSKALEALIDYFKADQAHELIDYIRLKSQELEAQPINLLLGENAQEVKEHIANHQRELAAVIAKREALPLELLDQVLGKSDEFEARLQFRIHILGQALDLHALLEESFQSLMMINDQSHQFQEESEVNNRIRHLDELRMKIEESFSEILAKTSGEEGGGLNKSIKEFQKRHQSLMDELISKRQALQRHSASMKNFQAKVEEVSDWLANFRSTLEMDTLVGQTWGQANAFLARSKESLFGLQRKAFELEGMQGAIKIIAEQNDHPTSTESVTNDVFQLSQILNLRIDLASTFAKFLKIAEDVLHEMKEFSAMLKSSEDEDNSSQMMNLESKRQNIQQLYLQVCTLNKNCTMHQLEENGALINHEDFHWTLANVMDNINGQQNQLIQEWEKFKSNFVDRQLDNERKSSAMASLWSKFTLRPILTSIDDPTLIVQSLETSYEILSQIRSLKRGNDGDPTLEEKIGRIEAMFQTLITFTKHLAELKALMTSQISYFKQLPTNLPTTLVEIEHLAEEHQQRKIELTANLVDLRNETQQVEKNIEEFHQFDQSQILILGQGLSFKPLIDELERNYEEAWQTGKSILTQAAKKCLLSAKFEEFKSSLQLEINALVNLLKGLRTTDDELDINAAQSVLSHSKISSLRQSAGLYHELDHSNFVYQKLREYDNLYEKCGVTINAKKEWETILGNMTENLSQLKEQLQSWDNDIENPANFESISQEIPQLQAAQKRLQSEWIIKLCRLSQVIYDSHEHQIPTQLKSLQDQHDSLMTLLAHLSDRAAPAPPPRPPLPLMKPPKFVQPLEDTTIEAESQDLQLICRVESGSEKVDLIWFLNEQNITDYSIFDESSGYCTLKMEKGDSTSKNLSGTYVCKAVTLGGEDVTKSVVAIRKSPTKPAFYVPLKNKECFEGERVVLEAVVQQENVDVVWYRNHSILPPLPPVNHQYEILQKGDVHRLELHHLTDSAEFRIKASNSAGESLSSCFVTVKPRKTPKGKAPQIRKQLVGLSADENDRIELTAIVDGLPLPTALWFQNGHPLQNAPPERKICSTDNKYWLVIDKVKESATFTLEVYNDFGRAQCSAEVEVRVAMPPAPESKTMKFESRSMSIEMEEKSTLVDASSRRRESISSQIRFPTPSKFQKREVEFSDYESDWTGGGRMDSGRSSAKIQPKWRPYHSDTEDLGEPPKYRSVKPKLKEVKKRRPPPPAVEESSPPCFWETHQDIENLQRELRKNPKEFKSLQLLETSSKATVQKSTPSFSRIKAEKKRSSSATIRTEFISVKEKAKLLQEMVTSSEMNLPLNPEEIPGAVRVLPPASRSASADIFKLSSSSTASSLVRPEQRSKSTDLEQQHKKFESKFSASEESERIVKHQQSRQQSWQEDQESPDSPPTIQMTATRCSNLATEEETTAADNHNTSHSTDYLGGYEADTENTLKKKKLKPMFQPTKFVPRLTEDNDHAFPIWKPRNNIL